MENFSLSSDFMQYISVFLPTKQHLSNDLFHLEGVAKHDNRMIMIFSIMLFLKPTHLSHSKVITFHLVK